MHYSRASCLGKDGRIESSAGILTPHAMCYVTLFEGAWQERIEPIDRYHTP